MKLVHSESPGRTIRLQWIPGHSEIAENVEADRLAIETYIHDTIELTIFRPTDAKLYYFVVNNINILEDNGSLRNL